MSRKVIMTTNERRLQALNQMRASLLVTEVSNF